MIAGSGDAYKYLYRENVHGSTEDENYSAYRQRLVEQFKTILKGRDDIRNIGLSGRIRTVRLYLTMEYL